MLCCGMSFVSLAACLSVPVSVCDDGELVNPDHTFEYSLILTEEANY